MDNLTHSLVGALIGQTGLKKKTGLAMPALIIGANLPDVDAACFFWLEGTEHLGFRRGITHGPPALALLPLILAALLWGWDRWQASRGKRPEGRLPVHFGWLYALAFIGCLSHPALDWLNIYGIRLLEPFSSRWFYGDTLFIIDLWLWGLMGFATWWSLRQEKRDGAWRKTARQALTLALIYIGANLVWSNVQVDRLYQAAPVLECAEGVDCGHEIIASPVPGVPWRREIIAASAQGWATIPPGTPLVWENLRPLTTSPCYAWTDDEIAALNSQTAAFMLWSRAPFVEREADGTAWLRDARFYDPRARGRFTVEVPAAYCEELPDG